MERTIPDTPDAAVAPLDCERLDCYRLAVEFQALAVRLASKGGLRCLRDQLDRASISIVLNIAEGAGRRSTADKGHFFTIARGSAMECAAILELLLARCVLSAADHRQGRGLLVRIVQVLTRLATRRANGGALERTVFTDRPSGGCRRTAAEPDLADHSGAASPRVPSHV